MQDEDPEVVEGVGLEELPFPGRRRSPRTTADPLGDAVDTIEEDPVAQSYARAQQQVGQRRTRDIPRYPTLETMYAAMPELAAHGRIRIERTEPKWDFDSSTGQRIRASGILDYHSDLMSTQQIAERYGGYSYHVYGMLEMDDKTNPGGPPKFVDRGVAEFTIPRPPALDVQPAQEGADMWRRGAVSGSSGNNSGVDPLLGIVERLTRGNNPTAPSDTVFRTVAEQGQASAQQIREMAQAQVDMLRHENEAMRQKLDRIEAQASNKQSDIVSLTQAVAALNQSSRTSASSEELRALRDQHEQSIARLKEDHARELDRVYRERDRENERMRAEVEARVERAEDKLKDQREMAERRERDMRDEYERRERSLRDDHQRQMEAMKGSYETRIAELQAMHDRELRMQSSMADNTTRTVETAHGVELRATQNELAKTAAELSQKQQLVEAYMAEQNKPLLERVTELRQMAEALGFISGKDDTPEVAVSPQTPLGEKILTMLVGQADKIIPELRAMIQRGGPEAAKAQQQLQQVQQLASHPQAQQAAALPPRRGGKMQFDDSEGPPLVTRQVHPRRRPDGFHGAVDIGAEGAAPQQFAPPLAQPQQRQMMQQPRPTATPQPQPAPQPQEYLMQPSTPPVQRSRPPQRPEPPEELPVDVPWQHFEWLPIDREKLQAIMKTLATGCAERTDATQVVETFVAQYGDDVVLLIPEMVDVDKLVTSIRADIATRNTMLASGRGKRYLEDVWTQLTRYAEKRKGAQQDESAERSEEPLSS